MCVCACVYAYVCAWYVMYVYVVCVYICVWCVCFLSRVFLLSFLPLHYFMASENCGWEFVSWNLRQLKKVSQCPKGAFRRSQCRSEAPERNRRKRSFPSAPGWESWAFQGEEGKACVFRSYGHKACMMVNCRGQLSWAMRCPNIWPNIILDVSVRCFWVRLTFKLVDFK